ncbi:hypothetical protein GYB57_04145 [bacterium]|nr:hypothetical protein [bacterium]
MIRYCLLTVGLLFGIATSAQQSKLKQELSITLQQQRLEDVLFLIAEKGAFNISFNPKVIESDSLITESYQKEEVISILNDLLPSHIEVVDLGHSILLRDLSVPKAPLKKIEMRGLIQDQNEKPVSGALLFEVEGLVSTLSGKDGTFHLNEKLQESGRLTFSVTKEGCLDTLVQISVNNDPVLIQLNCRLKENELIPLMPLKEYTLPHVPYVLVPLKVQESSTQSKATLFRKYQFSLVPGIGTNQLLGGLVENQYSLNLVGGYSLGVSKIEMGAGFNIVRTDAQYLQMAGGFNMVGANFKGLQMAGGFNYVGHDYNGVQLAGGVNYIGSNFRGTQLSGGVNIINGNFNGVQISGGYNHARISDGIQLAGGINLADTLIGLQLAPVNVVRVMKGVQVGVVNVADSSTGPMFGLVNIVRKGGVRSLELSSDMLPHLNLVFKLGTPQWYNIYSAGGSYINNQFLWNYGLGFGTRRILKSQRPIYYESMVHWLFEGKRDQPMHYGLWSSQVAIGNKSFRKIQLSAGPTFNLLLFNPSNALEGTKSILPYRFLSVTNSSFQIDAWVGFKIFLGFGNKF